MKKTNLLSIIYFVSSFIGPFLWIIGFHLYRFLGASSLVDSFVMAVATESKIATVFFLIWFLGILVSLISTFIIAIKKQNYLPFLIVIGVDLLFSAFILFYSILFSGGVMFFEILFGGIIRSLYYAFLIRFIKEEKRG